MIKSRSRNELYADTVSLSRKILYLARDAFLHCTEQHSKLVRCIFPWLTSCNLEFDCHLDILKLYCTVLSNNPPHTNYLFAEKLPWVNQKFRSQDVFKYDLVHVSDTQSRVSDLSLSHRSSSIARYSSFLGVPFCLAFTLIDRDFLAFHHMFIVALVKERRITC